MILTCEHRSIYTEQCYLDTGDTDHPRDGDKRESWQMKIVLLVAAVAGLGAVMAANVVPDVSRYLRIRRM